MSENDGAQAHPALAGGALYLDYNATTPVDPEALRAAPPSAPRGGRSSPWPPSIRRCCAPARVCARTGSP
ncbi:hypothetical protein [Nonomuraea harbinensis]|uniref:Aminotransferase class V domain-containing protein n=1 Tax=Nonomuraea harbinensis TaxID=1286938 RepID=A0ABW1BPQ4_9ACTN|nr:hypothetical protein [Nonomuraea harbinensis]